MIFFVLILEVSEMSKKLGLNHHLSTYLDLKRLLVCTIHMYAYLFIRDHPFKTSACLGGTGPCADGQKVIVHKDQKSHS